MKVTLPRRLLGAVAACPLVLVGLGALSGWMAHADRTASVAESIARLQESHVSLINAVRVRPRFPSARVPDAAPVEVHKRESLADAHARAKELGLGTVKAAGMLLYGQPDPRWVSAAGGRDRMPGTLRWPIPTGWFTRGYGSGEDGYHQAVDIMGELGAPVRAAASGIVGYAGSEVRGYGNIVILIHSGGWITMYAHNTKNLVVSGERVQRGQLIGELGTTGISRGPHVHFEFIARGKSCDPSTLFRPGIRHRSGQLTPLDPKTWTSPKKRPREVVCQRRRRYPHSRWVDDDEGEDSQTAGVERSSLSRGT